MRAGSWLPWGAVWPLQGQTRVCAASAVGLCSARGPLFYHRPARATRVGASRDSRHVAGLRRLGPICDMRENHNSNFSLSLSFDLRFPLSPLGSVSGVQICYLDRVHIACERDSYTTDVIVKGTERDRPPDAPRPPQPKIRSPPSHAPTPSGVRTHPRTHPPTPTLRSSTHQARINHAPPRPRCPRRTWRCRPRP